MSIGLRMKSSVCALPITGSSRLGMQVMEQAARKSSTSHAAVGMIITWLGYPFLQLPAAEALVIERWLN